MSNPLEEASLKLVFSRLWLVGAAGLSLLLFQSLAQPSWPAAWQYLFVGGLAAILGSGVGGLLGLIFALPQSGVVAGGSPSGQVNGEPSPQGRDWYNDSSTLEKIATAATTAIIALSLANFDKMADRFDGAATAIGIAMQGARDSALDVANRRLVVALVAEKSAERPDAPGPAAQERRKAALRGLAAAQVGFDQAKMGAEVQGALLLGGYGLIAFALAYLWTRRYLPAELANARLAMRRVTREDEADAAALEKAQANKLAQAVSKADTNASLLTDAIAKIPDSASVRLVQPGHVQDDPWKGQFGGQSSNDTAEVIASVRPVAARPGLFFVDLTIRGRNDADRESLANSSARLYLHPSFPDPIIRPVTFGADGQFGLTLVAYGAFTLGVQFLPGGELLELDLAGLRDAPTAFRLN